MESECKVFRSIFKIFCILMIVCGASGVAVGAINIVQFTNPQLERHDVGQNRGALAPQWAASFWTVPGGEWPVL
jgi:hypothetical protein